MINSQDFAKRLQKIIDFYGLSATAFSDKIEFNRSTISHLLSGRNKPSLDFIIKVVQEFPEVELYWLINGKGSFPTTTSIPEKNTSPIANDNSELQKKLPPPVSQNLKQSSSVMAKEIERIVIFFSDGSFQLYE